MGSPAGIANRVKETFAHGAVYGFGQVAAKVIGFLLIPVYTRFLSTSDYGVLALLTICGSLALSIFGLGLSSAMFRSYYDYKRSKDRQVVVSTAFFITLASAGALWAVGSFFAPFLSKVIFETGAYSKYFNLIFLTTSLTILSGLPLAVYRAKKWSKKYSILNLLFFAFRLLLTIYFVAFLRKGVWGVLMANLGVSIVQVVTLFSTILRDIAWTFSKVELRKMLAFGVPLIATNLGGLILNMSDRFFLKHYCSLSEVGLYNLGYQLGMIVQIVLVEPFKLVWPPMVFSIKEEPYAEAYYSKMFTYFLFTGIFICLGISLLSREMIQVMTDRSFWSAYRVVPIIVLGYLFWGGRLPVNVGIALTRKTQYYATVNVAGAMANIFLNLLLVPRYGMMGAAWVTLISFAMMWVMQWKISQHLYFIKYEWIRVTKLFAIALAMYWGLSRFSIENVFTSIAVKSALCLMYPFVLLVVGFYDEKEREKMSQYARRLRLVSISWLSTRQR